MRQRTQKTALFLCTGNCFPGRCAGALFNSVALKMGLPWTSASRLLTLEKNLKKAGKLTPAVLNIVNAMGLRATDEWAQPPTPLSMDDLEKADWVVALNQAQHLPLLKERFPAWVEKVESWRIDDSPEALARIEHEVMDLTARLIRGGEPRKDLPPGVCQNCRQPQDACTCHARKSVPKNVTVRVGRETKGRHGKGVTTIADLPLDENGLAELATKLKQRLGTGGTVREGRVEIQGDQRERIAAELEGLGYRVKRVGG